MITIQVAILIGAMSGFITYHAMMRKKIDQAFQKGASFGLKEGFDSGFPQGVILAARNFREELKPFGIVFDKDVSVEQTRPGMFKIQTFVEVTRPGQDQAQEET